MQYHYCRYWHCYCCHHCVDYFHKVGYTRLLINSRSSWNSHDMTDDGPSRGPQTLLFPWIGIFEHGKSVNCPDRSCQSWNPFKKQEISLLRVFTFPFVSTLFYFLGFRCGSNGALRTSLLHVGLLGHFLTDSDQGRKEEGLKANWPHLPCVTNPIKLNGRNWESVHELGNVKFLVLVWKQHGMHADSLLRLWRLWSTNQIGLRVNVALPFIRLLLLRRS